MFSMHYVKMPQPQHNQWQKGDCFSTKVRNKKRASVLSTCNSQNTGRPVSKDKEMQDIYIRKEKIKVLA